MVHIGRNMDFSCKRFQWHEGLIATPFITTNAGPIRYSVNTPCIPYPPQSELLEVLMCRMPQTVDYVVHVMTSTPCMNCWTNMSMPCTVHVVVENMKQRIMHRQTMSEAGTGATQE
jgi:hypothetical protein